MCQVDWDLVLKALTFVTIAITAWKSIVEFRNSQKWKRAEFLANEYNKFLDDQFVQKTFIMFDGYSISIPVNKNEIDGMSELIDFYPQKLKKALSMVDTESSRPKDEIYIRICIDRFLFKMGVFQSYLESRLITKEQLYPYFQYWMKVIGDQNDVTMEPGIKLVLHKFIKKYDYKNVINLLGTFGYTI